MATRHLLRTVALQTLYEWDFHERKHNLVDILERNMKVYAPGVDEPEFAWNLIKRVVDHMPQIDDIITKAAPEWPINRIPIIDRNVLRLGLSELLFAPKEEVPAKVAINESVELAKNYGGPNSGRFINGVLGTVFREIDGGKDDGKETKSKSDSAAKEEKIK